VSCQQGKAEVRGSRLAGQKGGSHPDKDMKGLVSNRGNGPKEVDGVRRHSPEGEKHFQEGDGLGKIQILCHTKSRKTLERNQRRELF